MNITLKQKKQFQKNLLKTFDLIELCMELRKGYLKTQNQRINAKELSGKIIEGKQNKWQIS